MSVHLGAYAAGDTIYHAFTTIDSTGAASALSSGALAVYKNDGTTQDTDGLTLTASFDAVTGLNMVKIDTSADAVFYADGGSFTVVLSAGTVDSVSVVGYVVCRFDLRLPEVDVTEISGAAPETAATIRAEIDSNSTQLAAIVQDTGTDIPASLTAIDDFLDTEIAAIKAVTDLLPDAGALSSLATAAALATVDTNVASILADTGTDGVALANGAITSAKFGAAAVDAAALATDAVTEIADGLLNRNLATGTDSGSETVRTVRQALRALRNKVTIAAGTLTVLKEDDATASWTAAVTTTAGDPISSLDPTST